MTTHVYFDLDGTLTDPYEGITRRRPSPKQQGFMQQAGIVLLLAMLVMVTIIDIGRMF